MSFERMRVFTGNANPKLAEAVVRHMNISLGRCIVGRFSDGEVMVELLENVRGRDVFVLQSTCAPTNDSLMEILVMVDALKRASAGRITAAIPYFGYARQDRRPRSARVAITAKVVADMLMTIGVNRVMTMDLHADQIQGFFNIPVDNIYATPPCYNPAHHHKSPMDSVYAMGDIYKIIFETTRALKANSVTQSCPCGTPPSLAWFRYMDQAVTADPVGSVQVRRRMKMYKALLGPRAAIYGDHVELTRISGVGDNEQDVGSDFASTLGTGGVLGTKFTWPDYGPKLENVYLDSVKEPRWKKWISLYNDKMLSKGNFLDLYVYGYDAPEAYAIEKDGNMFYAFYAPDKPGKPVKGGDNTGAWKGQVELRGLQARSYKIVDYVNSKDYGTVTGPVAKLNADFTGSLLLEATPLPNTPVGK